MTTSLRGLSRRAGCWGRNPVRREGGLTLSYLRPPRGGCQGGKTPGGKTPGLSHGRSRPREVRRNEADQREALLGVVVATRRSKPASPRRDAQPGSIASAGRARSVSSESSALRTSAARGDRAVEAGVAGLVDLPHPARPEGGHDLIRPETRTRREGHSTVPGAALRITPAGTESSVGGRSRHDGVQRPRHPGAAGSPSLERSGRLRTRGA